MTGEHGMVGRLRGRVVMVTGAASGIGSAIAARSAAEGAELALVERDEIAAHALADKFGDGAMCLACDVTDAGSAEAAVTAAMRMYGRLDGLVHNAAAPSVDGTVADLDPKQWHREVDVSLTGAFLMSKYAVPAMRATGGSIVLIASQFGSVATTKSVAYCAAKAGLLNLARAMAIDHGAEGIRVNSLSPGPVGTARLLQRWPDLAAANAGLGHLTVLGRIARPEEIAAAAAFLLSDDASYVTGSDLLVDGGYNAR